MHSPAKTAHALACQITRALASQKVQVGWPAVSLAALASPAEKSDLRDREASANVDGRGRHGGRRERLRGRVRNEAAARQQHAPDGGEPADRVGDRHERAVQRGRYAPHRLVATDRRQAKLCERRRERGAR
eukprot:360203-Chlamydomonas_euryale.AAC.1